MIREATEQDLEQILDIYNDAILHTTAVYHYAPQSLSDRKLWFEQKTAAKEPVLVFEEAGKVLGFATYGAFRPWPAYKYTTEHSIYVGNGGKGKGIGTRLLQDLIQLATAAGLKTMVAGIDASNPASIGLHEKLGFVHAGTIRNAGFKFGKWLDLAFYQLTLPGPENPEDGAPQS